MAISLLTAYHTDHTGTQSIFEGTSRLTVEGVEEFRQAVLEQLMIHVPEDGEAKKCPVLVAIRGGKA